MIHLINDAVDVPFLHTFLQALCCFSHRLGHLLGDATGEAIDVT